MDYRVFFIGAPVDATKPELPFQNMFDLYGWNTGNLLIGHSLKKHIAFSRHRYGATVSPFLVENECQLIAIPAANFIFQGFDMGWLADYLEQTTLPILVVGLGAQLPSVASAEIAVPEGTKRFLKIISERCIDIGVRGEFTADVLSQLGVKNVTITGCPSFYSPEKPSLSIKKKPFSEVANISVNGSRNVYNHSYDQDAAKRVESSLIRFSQQCGHDYVMQNEEPEIRIIYQPDTISDENFADLGTLSVRHGLGVTQDEYLSYLRQHGKLFWSIEEWEDYIRAKDLSIGTRFHGNLIALLNETPAILFTHDSRTFEMAQFMQLPHYRIEDCDITRLQKMYEDADFSAFESRYSQARTEYVRFLDRNKVPHTFARRDEGITLRNPDDLI